MGSSWLVSSCIVHHTCSYLFSCAEVMTTQFMTSTVYIILAIAVNNVEDTRLVLDYYKQKGECQILDTFKVFQAQLRAEEEKWNREVEAQRSQISIGKISPFSLNKKKHSRQQTVSLSSADCQCYRSRI